MHFVSNGDIALDRDLTSGAIRGVDAIEDRMAGSVYLYLGITEVEVMTSEHSLKIGARASSVIDLIGIVGCVDRTNNDVSAIGREIALVCVDCPFALLHGERRATVKHKIGANGARITA